MAHTKQIARNSIVNKVPRHHFVTKAAQTCHSFKQFIIKKHRFCSGTVALREI